MFHCMDGPQWPVQSRVCACVGHCTPWPLAIDGVCGGCVRVSSSGSRLWFPFRQSLLSSVCVLSLPRVSRVCGPLSSRAGTRLQCVGLPDTRADRGPQLSLPPQQHSNASQSLCDIIRLSREQMIQVQDSPEPDQLLATLEKWVAGSPRSGAGEPSRALLPDAPAPAPGRRPSNSS